jgi:hypothetical protein
VPAKKLVYLQNKDELKKRKEIPRDYDIAHAYAQYTGIPYSAAGSAECKL